MNRRDFIKGLLAIGTSAALPASAAAKVLSEPLSSPSLTSTWQAVDRLDELLSDGNWHFFTYVSENGVVKVYVDGKFAHAAHVEPQQGLTVTIGSTPLVTFMSPLEDDRSLSFRICATDRDVAIGDLTLIAGDKRLWLESASFPLSNRPTYQFEPRSFQYEPPAGFSTLGINK